MVLAVYFFYFSFFLVLLLFIVVLETNSKPETAPSLLWETLKAYLRGFIISFQASRRKHSKEEQLKLEDQIQKLDAENA